MEAEWRIFIHLSDIHFNKASGGAYDLDKDLRNELTLDSQKIFQALGGPDAILITGDIAFSGDHDEYKVAKSWLSKYTEKLDRSLANVFCVPGNHDVDQASSCIKSPLLANQRNILREIEIKQLETKFDEFLNDSITQEFIFQPIDEYNRFASAFKCNIWAEKPKIEQIFILNDKSQLKLHGLNSIIISDSDDNKYHKIVMGRYQLPERMPGITNLIMCHHPPDWWRDRDLIEKSFNARASIQLYGHKHNQHLEKVDNSLRIISGAVHPSRREPNWKPRYNWFRVAVSGDDDSRKLIIEVYPRIWDDNKFISDQFFCNGQEFKIYELNLERWKFSEDPQASVDIKPNKSDNYPDFSYDNFNEFGNMDPSRILAYRFFDLPHVVRISIASDLDLYLDEDEGLEDSAIFERIFERACSKKVLDLLWDKIEERHNDNKYPSNPFK